MSNMTDSVSELTTQIAAALPAYTVANDPFYVHDAETAGKAAIISIGDITHEYDTESSSAYSFVVDVLICGTCDAADDLDGYINDIEVLCEYIKFFRATTGASVSAIRTEASDNDMLRNERIFHSKMMVEMRLDL